MDNKMNCKIPDPRGNFRKVVIPAAMGDDSGEFAPQNGAYHDALVKYEANGAIYIYSSDGIPTKISYSVDGLKALAFKDKADYDEDIINKPEIPEKTSDLVNDSGFITSEYHDASKQDVLTAGSNITIEDDVISATIPSLNWGSITGYISDQTDLYETLNSKQGKLTAGNNITITKPTFTVRWSGSRMGVIMNAPIGEPLDGTPRGSSSTGYQLTIADRSVLGTVRTTEAGIEYDDLVPLKDGTTTVQYGIPGSTQEEMTFTVTASLRDYVISATVPSPTWGSITGTISNQTDLQNALGGKQNVITAGTNLSFSGNTLNAVDTTYTAGDNITIENNVISATGGSSYELVNETIEGDDASLVLGDLDLTSLDGGGLMFIKNTEDEETTRSIGTYGVDDIEIAASNLDFEGTDGARFGGNNGWIAFDDGEVRIGSEGRDIILQPEGNTGKKVYYRDDNVMTYTADDEVATVGYVNEHGGGTPVEAGKGIEVEEYAPLSITMEVTGELPPDFEDILPVSISLTNVKPGTNMYDLYLEGVLSYEQMFYWDTVYDITTSGIDSEVISIFETDNELQVIQFNGAGTTTGTITATRGAETYTANVTATITAGDNASYVSKGRYQFPIGVLMAAIEMSFGDKIDDPEELLEIFQGQDNVDALIDAIKKGYEFYGSADGVEVRFHVLMGNERGISLLLISDGDFDNAIISMQFEDGEIWRLAKNEFISTFTEDSDGLVPKPGSSQASSKYLKGNGTWQTLNTYALTLTFDDDTTATLNLKGE